MSKIKSAYWNVIDGGDYELKPKKAVEQTLQSSKALQAFKTAHSYQRTNELRNKLKARFKGIAEAVANA